MPKYDKFIYNSGTFIIFWGEVENGYKNLTEENLVLMAQEGDSMALETLIKGFQGF